MGTTRLNLSLIKSMQKSFYLAESLIDIFNYVSDDSHRFLMIYRVLKIFEKNEDVVRDDFDNYCIEMGLVGVEIECFLKAIVAIGLGFNLSNKKKDYHDELIQRDADFIKKNYSSIDENDLNNLCKDRKYSDAMRLKLMAAIESNIEIIQHEMNLS